MHTKFVDDIKLGRAVNSLKGRQALQIDSDKLEGWATTNCMNESRCWILHRKWGKPECIYGMEESLVCLGNQKGQLYPGVHQAQSAKVRECLALLCSGEVSPQALRAGLSDTM